jgi:hypothetical protein
MKKKITFLVSSQEIDVERKTRNDYDLQLPWKQIHSIMSTRYKIKEGSQIQTNKN